MRSSPAVAAPTTTPRLIESNGDGALAWPRDSEANDLRINFDVDNTIVTDFRREQCEFFWSLYDEQF